MMYRRYAKENKISYNVERKKTPIRFRYNNDHNATQIICNCSQYTAFLTARGSVGEDILQRMRDDSGLTQKQHFKR